MKRILIALLLTALLLSSYPMTARGESLPQVTITADSMTDWQGKDDVRIAILTFDDKDGLRFSMPITIHVQGNRWPYVSKISYTIKLHRKVEMSPGWGAHKKYALKSNFNDPTVSRNIVSGRLAAQIQRKYHLFDSAPNAGLVDGFPIWLTINGEPAGLYTWNMPKDEWLFGMDKNDENHLLFCGKDWTEDIFFSAEEVDYEQGWIPKSKNMTPEGKVKFERLYRFIRDSSDETFRAEIGQYLNLDACLNYVCFCYVSYAADNTGKNMILGTYDGRVWWPSLYDLDETWGNCWDGKSYKKNKGYMLKRKGLFKRILQCFPEELGERYRELRASVLSMDNIRAEFERFRAQIPEEYFEWNNALTYPDGCPYPDYDELYSRIAVYLPVYDEYFNYVPE